jgi:hypothetical protein
VCAQQHTSLHHVRFGGRTQTWHTCAKECCALCGNREAYHQVVQRDGDWVFENCTAHARTWCAAGDRGGLKDAAWLSPADDGTDQCVPPAPPPRTCTARCCGGSVLDAGTASSPAQCDAQGQEVCAAHQTTLHHVRFDGNEQSPHPCAAECCALCENRMAYHQVTQADGDWVFENCADHAAAWCAQGDRGGLNDAAWVGLKTDGTNQCVPPPGYCVMQCHDGHEEATHVTAEQQCWDATHAACARHAGTEVLTLDGRELYRRPLHTCTVSCCDGAVVGPVNSESAAHCIYQDGPPLCAQRGSGLNHVRYDGALVKEYPCPRLCFTHCCDGRQGETWFNSQGECSNWAGAFCGNVKVNTIHYPKYNVIYNADSCRCCAKCRNRSNAYNVGPQVNCTDRARDWCSVRDRGGLQNAFWGWCPDPPN